MVRFFLLHEMRVASADISPSLDDLTINCFGWCLCCADNFEPFVKDVEDCVKMFAKIKKVKMDDVSLLLFFYHSIMDLFSDSMKEVSG